MKFNNFHKFLCLLFLGLILFVGIVFTIMLIKTYRESKIFKQTEKNLIYALIKAQGEVQVQEDYLKRFNQDPYFFEWIARQRIGYVTSREIIFRFGEEDANVENCFLGKNK